MTLLDQLNKFKERLVDYLKLKVDQQDWHGVADAAMDIREVETRIALLNELEAAGLVRVKNISIR